MQKISLFQLFILGVHVILESCNQIDYTHFWSFPPKNLSIKIENGWLVLPYAVEMRKQNLKKYSKNQFFETILF